MKEVALTSPMT